VRGAGLDAANVAMPVPPGIVAGDVLRIFLTREAVGKT
jgi:hypothetical protein